MISTIASAEEVYNQAKEEIDKINKEAGFKKFRNISHFIEQAVVNYVVDVIKNQSESPEAIIEKVVEVMWNRPAMLRGVFNKLLEMPEEDAVGLMGSLFSAEELKHLKKMCQEIRPGKEGKKGETG